MEHSTILAITTLLLLMSSSQAKWVVEQTFFNSNETLKCNSPLEIAIVAPIGLCSSLDTPTETGYSSEIFKQVGDKIGYYGCTDSNCAVGCRLLQYVIDGQCNDIFGIFFISFAIYDNFPSSLMTDETLLLVEYKGQGACEGTPNLISIMDMGFTADVCDADNNTAMYTQPNIPADLVNYVVPSSTSTSTSSSSSSSSSSGGGSDDKKSGTSSGKIAGIVIGVVILALVAGILCYVGYAKKKAANNTATGSRAFLKIDEENGGEPF